MWAAVGAAADRLRKPVAAAKSGRAGARAPAGAVAANAGASALAARAADRAGAVADAASAAAESSNAPGLVVAAADVAGFFRRRKRRAFRLSEHAADGQEALAWREEYRLMHKTLHGWLNAYLADRFGLETGDLHKDMRGKIRAAVRCAERRRVLPPARPGIRRLGQTVARSQRKRACGAGRQPKCVEVAEELWDWFVDQLGATEARITTEHLRAQAHVIAGDLQEYWQQRVERGEADPTMRPSMPVICDAWLTRWRRKYGVSYRTVNLRYKISHAKRSHRIGVFWRNCIRLRTFHQCLFGPGRLRFLGFDQKPMWFNSAYAAPTLARKGAKRVAVKENLAASRERFTVMTTCPSWNVAAERQHADWRTACAQEIGSASGRDSEAGAGARAPAALRDMSIVAEAPPALRTSAGGAVGLPAIPALRAGARAAADEPSRNEGALALVADPAMCVGARAPAVPATPPVPPIGILFRSASENGERLRTRLRHDEHICLQFAPRGSYRLPQVLSFLEWAVPRASSPENAIVVVLDWFMPHLDESVAALLRGKNHALALIGGGITGDVQVGDTHRHGPYTKAYKREEINASAAALRLRPRCMPASSRQLVLDRATVAWSVLGHDRGAREWKENGILLALDGSEDGLLRSDLLPLWEELRMCEERERLVAEVQQMVRLGDLSEWGQHSALLEAYDDHEGLIEGLEAAQAQVVGPEGGSEDEDVLPDTEAPALILQAEADADEDAELEGASRQGSAGLGARAPNAADVDASDGSSMEASAMGRRLKALSDAAAALRDLKEDGCATFLENRVQSLLKTDRVIDREARLFLQTRRLERSAQDDHARQVAQEQDRKRHELEMQVKLAKAETEKAKAESAAQRAAARVQLQAAMDKRDASRRETAEAASRAELRRAHLAAFLVRRASTYFSEPGRGEHRRSRAKLAAEQWRKSVKPTPAFPELWDYKKTQSYVDIRPPVLRHSKDKPEWASEALAVLIYEGRDPREATTARTALARLDSLMSRTLPALERVAQGLTGVRGEYLRRRDMGADVTCLAVLWRYSHAVGPDAFPVGFHQWPLPAALEAEFIDFATPGGRSVVASSSSTAAPSGDGAGAPSAPASRPNVASSSSAAGSAGLAAGAPAARPGRPRSSSVACGGVGARAPLAPPGRPMTASSSSAVAAGDVGARAPAAQAGRPIAASSAAACGGLGARPPVAPPIRPIFASSSAACSGVRARAPAEQAATAAASDGVAAAAAPARPPKLPEFVHKHWGEAP